MKISTKGTYALKIMADIASSPEDTFSTVILAERNNVSIKYLEKIVNMLSKGGLLISHRGSNGGYKLSREASKISLGQILSATEGKLQTVSCISSGEKCDMRQKCLTATVWKKLDDLINNFLESVSLEDIVNKNIT